MQVPYYGVPDADRIKCRVDKMQTVEIIIMDRKWKVWLSHLEFIANSEQNWSELQYHLRAESKSMQCEWIHRTLCPGVKFAWQMETLRYGCSQDFFGWAGQADVRGRRPPGRRRSFKNVQRNFFGKLRKMHYLSIFLKKLNQTRWNFRELGRK